MPNYLIYSELPSSSQLEGLPLLRRSIMSPLGLKTAFCLGPTKTISPVPGFLLEHGS